MASDKPGAALGSHQAESDLYVVTHPGLERVTQDEVQRLGLSAREIEPGGVAVGGSKTDLYRLNLWLRTASRVLVRVAGFHARSFAELERHGKRVAWDRFLGPGSRVHLRITAKKSKLNHEGAIGERLQGAIAARVSGVAFVDRRADADEAEHDTEQAGSPLIQRLVVRFHRDECTISLDSSGALLHRRGYRKEGGKAPLRETLAAAVLLLAEWRGEAPLVDPLCGSGTIPIEAALIARCIPPGWRRRFPFERWPDFDARAFHTIRDDAASRILEKAPVPIVGSDRDAGAIAMARANAERAGVQNDIAWHQSPISAMTAPSAGIGLIASNPPYGVRIGDRDRLRNLYAQLGTVLHRKCPGWRVTLLSADRRLEGQTGIPWRDVARTSNGGLPVRIVAGVVP